MACCGSTACKTRRWIRRGRRQPGQTTDSKVIRGRHPMDSCDCIPSTLDFKAQDLPTVEDHPPTCRSGYVKGATAPGPSDCLNGEHNEPPVTGQVWRFGGLSGSLPGVETLLAILPAGSYYRKRRRKVPGPASDRPSGQSLRSRLHRAPGMGQVLPAAISGMRAPLNSRAGLVFWACGADFAAHAGIRPENHA